MRRHPSIQQPTVTKDPKPTVALDYNFARKKATSSSSDKAAQSKTVSNIWELAGDSSDAKLLEIPITSKTLANLSILVCVDLSKPQNAMGSAIKWIKAARDVISRRIAEMQV